MKSFLQADEDVLDAFATFGLANKPSYLIFGQMEKYICFPYRIGDINATDEH